MRVTVVATLALALAACSGPSFDQGVDAYNAKDYAKAMAQWRPLAEKGDARSQGNVGALYRDGLGVKADPVEAARWFALAAAQDNTDAEANLGISYAQGVGVPQNFVTARGLLAKAAAKNQSVAIFNLAVLYDNGQGGPVDKARAADLYARGANMGDGDAQANLGVDYAAGEGVAPDKVQAYKWFSLAVRGASDDGRKAQAAANLEHLKADMTPSEIAQGDQAIAAFKPASGDPASSAPAPG
jgi:TPR repeat protein